MKGIPSKEMTTVTINVWSQKQTAANSSTKKTWFCLHMKKSRTEEEEAKTVNIIEEITHTAKGRLQWHYLVNPSEPIHESRLCVGKGSRPIYWTNHTFIYLLVYLFPSFFLSLKQLLLFHRQHVYLQFLFIFITGYAKFVRAIKT